MRIAVMLRSLDEKGGIGVYTRNLIDTLLSIDHENEYLLLYRDPANMGRFAGRTNLREKIVRGSNNAVWDQIGVPLALRGERVDVVLNPKFTVPFFTHARSVMVLHGADWFLPDAAHFYTRLDRLYMHLFMPLYLKRAAAALSVSQLTTDHFNRIFRLPVGKVRTTYFGPAAHFRRITDAAALQRVKQRYSLPDKFLLTLSRRTALALSGAGAGGERKNIRGIFRAYERLHGTIPHKLVVVGKGCEHFRDDYALPRTGWGADVLFTGWIDQKDLPAVYTLSELFLYPSNMEAFPIPITEAMACGKAIVTSAANGLREIAGDAALLVNPSDADAVANAVRLVLADEAVRTRLEQAGLDRSREFTWDSCARQTLAALQDVALRGTPVPAGANV
jgi:glycosyltransferase involved in cell wall biosynthesis